MGSFLMNILTVGTQNQEVGYRFVDFLREMTSGIGLAYLGAAIAVIVSGIGSAIAVGKVGEAVSGLMSEYPNRFGGALVLQALPGTQGLYGFIITFMIITKLGLMSGNVPDLTLAQGMYFLFASLPVAIGGYFSALKQGRVAASGIALLAKQPKAVGKAITSAGLVELYAIFAMIISLFLVLYAPIAAPVVATIA